jgi:hypothetical protein
VTVSIKNELFIKNNIKFNLHCFACSRKFIDLPLLSPAFLMYSESAVKNNIFFLLKFIRNICSRNNFLMHANNNEKYVLKKMYIFYLWYNWIR